MWYYSSRINVMVLFQKYSLILGLMAIDVLRRFMAKFNFPGVILKI